MLLATYVFCFLCFCFFVVIKGNLKNKAQKHEQKVKVSDKPLCSGAYTVEQVELEKALKREVNAFRKPSTRKAPRKRNR